MKSAAPGLCVYWGSSRQDSHQSDIFPGDNLEEPTEGQTVQSVVSLYSSGVQLPLPSCREMMSALKDGIWTALPPCSFGCMEAHSMHDKTCNNMFM